MNGNFFKFGQICNKAQDWCPDTAYVLRCKRTEHSSEQAEVAGLPYDRPQLCCLKKCAHCAQRREDERMEKDFLCRL